MRILNYIFQCFVAFFLFHVAASAQSGSLTNDSVFEPASKDTFECVIKPSTTVKLAPPVPGVLSAINVERGDRVSKGDTLAKLYSEVEETDLELAQVRAENASKLRQAKLRIEFLERKRKRNKLLNRSKFVSDGILDEIVTDLQVARGKLDEERRAIELAKLEVLRTKAILTRKLIRSPIDGVVLTRDLSVGEYASEQTPVFTLAAIDTLYVDAFLPIARRKDITEGEELLVMPEDTKAGLAAQVDIIDNVYDVASGTFGVRLILDNSRNTQSAGVRCSMKLNQQKTAQN